MPHTSLCVVMTDWWNLRDQIFSRTGFAPSDEGRGRRGVPKKPIFPPPRCARRVDRSGQTESETQKSQERVGRSGTQILLSTPHVLSTRCERVYVSLCSVCHTHHITSVTYLCETCRVRCWWSIKPDGRAVKTAQNRTQTGRFQSSAAAAAAAPQARGGSCSSRPSLRRAGPPPLRACFAASVRFAERRFVARVPAQGP